MTYVLMSRKTTDCYMAVFNFIEKEIFRLGAAEFMTDFEAGLRKALAFVYPDARIRGCWFHYCAAIRKRSRALGMHALTTNNPNARMLLSELMSLPLLPAHQFEQGYGQIIQLAGELGLSKNFKKLFKYYESFWIKQVGYYLYLFSIRQILFINVQRMPYESHVPFIFPENASEYSTCPYVSVVDLRTSQHFISSILKFF